MEDREIIDLYFRRSEQAITETDTKYGALCRTIACNILYQWEDAEECVNDSYFSAWNRIPPLLPASLRAFLGKLVRDHAISRYRANHAQKRYSCMEVMLSELEDCIPSGNTIEKHIESAVLSDIISRWLRTLRPDHRAVFIRRYWYGESVDSLAREAKLTPQQMAQRMYILRSGLREAIEKEGESIE